ncbi:hypothetical protein Ami103574_07980 [Aminipila butyrica]|uniref:AAA domain-containing protein n=1 Tax=Aminipila butyrica TaxID=433296 RepID=A0A858BX17_9FIRM|nr:hypothetical protein [Aminipila butyrica]QIB69264.1 hypothetical protein Ami103574_07980 [Aminipila butyrica]
MDIITILFVSADAAYAKALASCVTETSKNMVFTLLDSQAYLRGNFAMPNLILFDWMVPEQEGEAGAGVVRLSERAGEADLFRYDTAENLAAQLLTFYSAKTGRSFPRPVNGPGKLVLFCSACGGTGKTSVALGLAEELSRFHGKRVLYLSGEEVESTGTYFQEERKKSLSNYLYQLAKQKDCCFPLEGAVLCSSYGVLAFSPAAGRNPLKELTMAEWSDFLEALQKAAPLDYIFVDGDDTLGEEGIWLASVCQHICLVSRPEQNQRQERYGRYLEHCLGRQVWDKMIWVVNFAEDENRGEAGREFIPAAEVAWGNGQTVKTVYVERDEASFIHGQRTDGSAFTTISIEREFGTGMKQLSSELTWILQ